MFFNFYLNQLASVHLVKRVNSKIKIISGLVKKEKAMDIENFPDRIAECFKGRKILITGGTGFMGKVLVEKFLRVLPDVGHIYLLVRPKKGKGPKTRLDEIFNSPVRD